MNFFLILEQVNGSRVNKSKLNGFLLFYYKQYFYVFLHFSSQSKIVKSESPIEKSDKEAEEDEREYNIIWILIM